MTSIVTSLLSGGWELVAGWILPTALNSFLFSLLVLPALQNVPLLHSVYTASGPTKALVLLVAAVVGGLVLSALQTPLYRLLEGYLWPAAARTWGIERQQKRKSTLEKRLRLARLRLKSAEGTLGGAETAELDGLREDPSLRDAPERKRLLTDLEFSMLAEQVRGYPVDKDQVLPTKLGNSIRRFEEYGYDRYKLDTVTMWNALTGVVPDQVRKQVDAARASVDFFVCLIYGQVIVAIAAIAALIVASASPVGPIIALIALVVLSPLWYRLAVATTAEWSNAVRGLVDLARKPLAESLSLELPSTLEQERTMWNLVSRLGRHEYDSVFAGLDSFRATRAVVPTPPETAPGQPPPG